MVNGADLLPDLLTVNYVDISAAKVLVYPAKEGFALMEENSVTREERAHHRVYLSHASPWR